MNRWLLVPLSLLTTIGLLDAQGAGPAKQKPGTVERRAKEMRRSIDSDKAFKSHVRVQVRLRNGNRLRGVVKDGKLVERVTGLRFVEAEASDRGAGIRLWYSGDTRSYVFVPFVSLAQYEILEKLSAKDIATIEGRMRMAEARLAEELRQKAEQRKREAERKVEAAKKGEAGNPPGGAGEPVGASPAPGGEGKPTADAKEQEQRQAWLAIVQAYPPHQGWNAAKRDEIKRRFVVIGARPSAFEQRFVDHFDEWLEACKGLGIDPEPKKVPAVEPGKK